MVISQDVLRKAAEQYACKAQRASEAESALIQERKTSILKMLQRCSSLAVRELLIKSNIGSIDFNVKIKCAAGGTMLLRVTRLSLATFTPGIHSDLDNMESPISMKLASQLLFESNCNIEELEEKFWAEIQKIVDNAPK